jgi:prevent-host-death family protein
MKIELVTTLKRHATRILDDLQQSKEPVLITEHGKPSAYLIDVDDYHLMQERLRILEGISQGEKAIQEGTLHTNSDARDRLKKWLK